MVKDDFLQECVFSEGLLKLLENMKGVLFFVKNRKCELVRCNLLLAEHCGFSSVEGWTNAQDDFSIFQTELAEHYRLDDLEVLESGLAKENIVELFPNYLGDLAWFVTTKIPLFDANGNVRGLCGILQNYENSSNLGRPLGEIAEALEYIKKNYTKKISNADLAGEVGLSVRQFENRFKEVFGTTPHKYVLKLRVLKACDLLLSKNVTILEVANQLGFYDQSAFNLHFKSQIGLTPLKYIKKHSN